MIYFLVDVGEPTYIDIGYSETPDGVLKRWRQHKSRNPRKEFYCAIEGVKQNERTLHDHFAPARVEGVTGLETYHAVPELVAYLEWLGTQPWAACSLAEVENPLAHYAPDVPWLPGQYQSNDYRSKLTFSLFDGPATFGPVQAPLTAKQRDVEWLRTTDDWYTPPDYIEAARRVMGSIDLDPASSQFANKTVKAGRIYTVNDDGLARSNDWYGNVWLNPPYGGAQAAFMERLVSEYKAGNVKQAVACLNSWGSTAGWFQPLWPHHICWATGRVKFLGGAFKKSKRFDNEPDAEPLRELRPGDAPSNGTAFVYLGPDTEAFVREFDQFGPITPGAVNRQEVAA